MRMSFTRVLRGYWCGWIGQCRSGVACPRELDLTGHGGRRRKGRREGGRATAGALVLFIGERAPGRG
jgi:hypothetical protein